MSTTDDLHELFDVVDLNDRVIGKSTRKECNSNPNRSTSSRKQADSLGAGQPEAVDPDPVCRCRGSRRNLTIMRKTTSLIAVLASICIAVGCTKVEEKKPIRIAINVWPGYAHAFVAQEKGFFEKNNVKVELMLKKNVSESKKLYDSGRVDGLFNVFPDVIMLNAKGIRTNVVYIVDYSDSGDVIIGRPEIASVADLRGRKISFEDINSFSHVFVLAALQKAGIEEYDVQFANVPAGDVLTFLEEDKIDAGHTWEPITTEALRKGFKVIARAGDVPGIIIDVLAFRGNVVKERSDEIHAIVKSMIEARHFVYSNRKEALEIMSKSEGIPIKELEEGIRGVQHPDLEENIQAMTKLKTPESLYSSGEFIMDFFVTRGQLSERLNLDTIIEPRFVNKIKREEQ